MGSNEAEGLLELATIVFLAFIHDNEVLILLRLILWKKKDQECYDEMLGKTVA
jgi:hypothetical protein